MTLGIVAGGRQEFERARRDPRGIRRRVELKYHEALRKASEDEREALRAGMEAEILALLRSLACNPSPEALF